MPLPYAYVNEDGTRTCPECGMDIAEQYDSTGESVTNNYAEHYEQEHMSGPRILTVYPHKWFGRTPQAKQHAFIYEGEVDRYGHPVSSGGKRISGAQSLCGIYGSASGNEFKATEPNVITCSRCVNKANKIRSEHARD